MKLDSIRPRIYKKTFYIGQKKILKLTKEGIRKFGFKAIWVLLLLVMGLTMILGGLAALLPQENSTQTLPANYIDLLGQ